MNEAGEYGRGGIAMVNAGVADWWLGVGGQGLGNEGKGRAWMLPGIKEVEEDGIYRDGSGGGRRREWLRSWLGGSGHWTGPRERE